MKKPNTPAPLLVAFNPPFRGDDLDEERYTSYYLMDSEGHIRPDKIFEHRIAEVLYDPNHKKRLPLRPANR